MLDDRSTLPCRKHLASVPDCMLTSHLRFSASYNIQQVISFSQLIYTIIPLKSVGVRKLQVAILARSSREMSLTVSIVWQYILSRVRVSVGPSIFFVYAKTAINYHESRSSRIWLLNGPAAPVTMRSRLNGQRPVGAESTAVILSQKQRNQPVETATIRVYNFTA